MCRLQGNIVNFLLRFPVNFLLLIDNLLISVRSWGQTASVIYTVKLIYWLRRSPSQEQIHCNGALGHHLYAGHSFSMPSIYLTKCGSSNTLLFDWIGSNQGQSVDECLSTEITSRDLSWSIFLVKSVCYMARLSGACSVTHSKC